MESSPAARFCSRRDFANGHGEGIGGHWRVAGRLPRRTVQVGGLGVDQRNDGDEFGGDRGPARSGSGF